MECPQCSSTVAGANRYGPSCGHDFDTFARRTPVKRERMGWAVAGAGILSCLLIAVASISSAGGTTITILAAGGLVLIGTLLMTGSAGVGEKKDVDEAKSVQMARDADSIDEPPGELETEKEKQLENRVCSEKVRLIKYNMELYRELLDRERALLKKFEKQRLDVHLPKIRERMREYERVVKLNRDQLGRLGVTESNATESTGDVEHALRAEEEGVRSSNGSEAELVKRLKIV